jgi:hypothetical protein
MCSSVAGADRVVGVVGLHVFYSRCFDGWLCNGPRSSSYTPMHAVSGSRFVMHDNLVASYYDRVVQKGCMVQWAAAAIMWVRTDVGIRRVLKGVGLSALVP